MKFLKIYDITNKLADKLTENGYERYYIQEDTNDYHIFRILKGNYDEENKYGKWKNADDGFTLERQNINKYDLLQFLEIDYRNKFEISLCIKNLIMENKLIPNLFEYDLRDGFCNWDYLIFKTIDECTQEIHENKKYCNKNQKEIKQRSWEIITMTIFKNDEYFLSDDNLNITNKIDKQWMLNYLKQYRYINVINRPALTFIIENILGKNSHGITIQKHKIDKQKFNWDITGF